MAQRGVIIGLVIIIIILAGISIWLASRPPMTKTVTVTATKTITVTKTVTSTVTAGMTVTKTATATKTMTKTATATKTMSPTATKTATMTAKPGKYIYIPPAPGKAAVIETSKAVIIVGPKGAKIPSFTPPPGKKIITVVFEVNKAKTKPPSKSTAFVNIDPAFYRDYYADALILAARKETSQPIREQLYEAVYKLSNDEVPILWLGQYVHVRVQWSWVKGRYYNPVLAERYDLLYEDRGAPKVPTGIGNYKNGPRTYVIATIGWPSTFDPAADYETFGWDVWHQIGDTLVTYWKSETNYVVPDLAVAWAHSPDGKTWYFVIRGGVKAYDPWHGKTYDIKAIDVLFTIWRIARLNLDPSWMITTFVDVNKSKVLTEQEFNQLLASGKVVAEYRGKKIMPTSLKQLLDFFGYSGPTAGVVELKLYQPYAAILSILADPFTSIIPMKYVFDYAKGLQGKYEEALKASDYGKNPAAWAKFIGTGENEPSHLLLNKYPVGTGPYYVASYKRDSYIVLRYNPYYWNRTLWNMPPYGMNGKPWHMTVIYIINNDAVSRIELFEKGVADVAVVPLDRLKDVKGYKYPGTNYEIIVRKGALEPTIVFIVLNAMKKPFDNKLVRKALMYAIPFQQIKDVVYAGYLARLYGVLPAGFPGHNDAIVEHYTFNLAKAMMLIRESGINPSKYSIEIWYNQGNTQREKIATLLQQTWGQLGFKVTVKPLSWPTLLSKTEKGDFQVYIIGWAPDYLDPDDYAGPLYYGGTVFSLLKLGVFTSLSQAQSFLSMGG